jgi:DNA-binding MarR family transcriptional regulator
MKLSQSALVKSSPPDQIGWMISLEDWALIRHLHRSEKLSQRAIAKQLGVARDTVGLGWLRRTAAVSAGAGGVGDQHG